MKNNNSNGGVSVIGLLGVAFVVLKLCGVIDWSWWLVLTPFWVQILLALIVAYLLYKVEQNESKKTRW